MKGQRRISARRRVVALAVALCLCAAIVDYAAYPYGAPPPGRSGNQGSNGLWLRDTWYFGDANKSEVQELQQRLHENQIAYAYCHVRGTRRDGTLAYHCANSARRLVAEIHQHNPSTKVIAWIYAGNARAGGNVDLSNPHVRSAMAREARWLTTVCGFDGVQWDYEVCTDRDQNFLRLLQQTQAALPSGKTLSVAAALWLPAPLTHWGWSSAYFQNVAHLCDQIVIMGYDSGVYMPRAYVWLMARQVACVSQAVGRGNPQCRLLIGIPTYRSGGLSHDAHTETISMALRGVRTGLGDPGTDRRVFSGVAIFADYTTTPSDWRIYRRWWLNR